MEIAEIIVRTDLEIRSVSRSLQEAWDADNRLMIKLLGMKLDALRTRRTELADRMYQEVGLERTMELTNYWRQELDHLYGR